MFLITNIELRILYQLVQKLFNKCLPSVLLKTIFLVTKNKYPSQMQKDFLEPSEILP